MSGSELKLNEEDNISFLKILIGTIVTCIIITVITLWSMFYYRTTLSDQQNAVERNAKRYYKLVEMDVEAKKQLDQYKKLSGGYYQIPIDEAIKIIDKKYK